MANWKTWLKGVIDGRPAGKSILVTGSARMEPFRHGGESLAGRYVACRLHPVSVREWCEQVDGLPANALERLIERGGFPEPCLATDPVQADRWRRQYFTDLIREDVVEFSHIHEVNTMRLFAEKLRDRVGSPLSLASIARDLAVSPATLARYLEILQALYIVFTVHRQDAFGEPAGLHYIRTKDDAEVDFALSNEDRLTHLVECKESDTRPHHALTRFASMHPGADTVQLVHHLRQEEVRPPIAIVDASRWLANRSA